MRKVLLYMCGIHGLLCLCLGLLGRLLRAPLRLLLVDLDGALAIAGGQDTIARMRIVRGGGSLSCATSRTMCHGGGMVIVLYTRHLLVDKRPSLHVKPGVVCQRSRSCVPGTEGCSSNRWWGLASGKTHSESATLRHAAGGWQVPRGLVI